MVGLVPPTAGRANVLRVYREMLRVARRMPTPKEKEDAAQQVRAGFRANADAPDPAAAAELLRKAESRLSFMRIVSWRDGRGQTGASRTVYAGGAQLGDAPLRKGLKPVSNWTGTNMDPDSVQRHQRTIRRAGFVNNAHVQGPWGF